MVLSLLQEKIILSEYILYSRRPHEIRIKWKQLQTTPAKEKKNS